MTIAEVSRNTTFRRHPALLRAHRPDPHGPPHAGGIRDYAPEDCNWVELAKCIARRACRSRRSSSMSPLFQRGEETFEPASSCSSSSATACSSAGSEIQRGIDRLNGKIAGYERIFAPLSARCGGDPAGIDAPRVE